MKKVQISTRDIKKLSAYLDGQIHPRQSVRLETRLDQEPDLKAAFIELQRTRNLLQATPHLRSPRNFTLTPEMAGVPVSSKPRLVPAYRMMSAVASLLLVLVIAGDLMGIRTMKNAPSADQAMPSIAEVQEDDAAIVMEAMEVPAAEALVAGEAVEGETFSTQTDLIPEDHQKSGVAVEDRAVESEPLIEPPTVGEAEAEMEADGSVEEAEVIVEKEAPMLMEAPPAEETALNTPEVAVEDVTESSMDEEPAQSPIDNIPLAAQPEPATGIPMDVIAPQEPALDLESGWDTSGSDWPLVRFIETGLALVAVTTGILAWVYRRRV